MRNLTVQRNKTMVGCLMKMKVYIEDAEANELVINGTPCRLLGTLRSGHYETFPIGNGEARLFVIADKLSKDYCNDVYVIPAGEEDIFVSGKNKFNPASGNAFRFDVVSGAEVVTNRRRGSRKGLIVLCAAIIIGFVIGFIGTSAIFSLGRTTKDKVFRSDGFEITLTNAFSETEEERYDICYASEEAVVFVLKEDFSAAEGFGGLTLDEYSQLVIESNPVSDNPTLLRADGYNCFEYTYTSDADAVDYTYMTCMYKGDTAFWIVQFVCPADKYPDRSEQYAEWAKTVKVGGADEPSRVITEITDRAEAENIPTDQAEELFYSDELYNYSFSSIRSQYVIVKFADGTTKTVKEALADGEITIADLDEHGIHYYRESL